jgi:fibronectin type III domain protein
MDSWTNVEETDIPPQITGDPAEIDETLVNSHLRPNSDVFQGFYHIILPNKFLVDMGVNDPTTLAADGIAATIGSGTVTVTPGPTSTEVDVVGITFSPRKLRVKRGDVKPTRPTKLHLRRSSSHHIRLSFHHAKPRGSRITGYEGRCVAKGQPTRFVSGKHSPLVDKALHSGVRYRCQVRAKSKAGAGSWSKHRTLISH